MFVSNSFVRLLSFTDNFPQTSSRILSWPKQRTSHLSFLKVSCVLFAFHDDFIPFCNFYYLIFLRFLSFLYFIFFCCWRIDRKISRCLKQKQWNNSLLASLVKILSWLRNFCSNFAVVIRSAGVKWVSEWKQQPEIDLEITRLIQWLKIIQWSDLMYEIENSRVGFRSFSISLTHKKYVKCHQTHLCRIVKNAFSILIEIGELIHLISRRIF